MALTIVTKRVGSVPVVTCAGRIGEWEGCHALQQHLEQVLPREPRVVLHLAGVHSIDSAGLGLLVRWLSRTETLGGSLKLCAAVPRVREVLRKTRLDSVLDVFATEAEALAAFQRPGPTPSPFGIGTEILCAHRSANVLSFLRESLSQAGYRVATTSTVADAVMLLQSVKPKVVVVDPAFRSAGDSRAARIFNQLLDQRECIVLPETFASDQPEVVGSDLLEQVHRLMEAAPWACRR